MTKTSIIFELDSELKEKIKIKSGSLGLGMSSYIRLILSGDLKGGKLQNE